MFFQLTPFSRTRTMLVSSSGVGGFYLTWGLSFDRGFLAGIPGYRDSYVRPSGGRHGTRGKPCFDFCSSAFFVFTDSTYIGD
jgi:hypothetical protein